MTDHGTMLDRGYSAALAIAVELRGDLARILGHAPVATGDLTADELREWTCGFNMARVDVTDLLVPDDAELAHWIAEHTPDDADHQAVLALAEGRGPISQIRSGLFGDD